MSQAKKRLRQPQEFVVTRLHSSHRNMLCSLSKILPRNLWKSESWNKCVRKSSMWSGSVENSGTEYFRLCSILYSQQF
jgi:hypothetical protein